MIIIIITDNNNAILKYPTKILFDPLTGRIVKKISDNNFLYDTLHMFDLII